MFKILWLILALILSTHCTNVLAVGNGGNDGNKLLARCNAVIQIMDEGKYLKDNYNAGICVGLMQGITNLNLHYQAKEKKGALFCLPENGIQNGQAARIVVKYLKGHPEKLQENASFLAIDAFVDAYPCSH